jgi:hypothetical protein
MAQKLGFMLLIILAISALPAVAQEEMSEDNAGKSCGECHVDYHAAWASGVHAIAYDRESFQEAWAAENNNPECLKCHTTDFQPATGSYLAENIECEACHGLNPANHPPEPITVRTEAAICGDCHTATFDEWEHSLHAFSEDMGAIGCATCHNPHGQTIRLEGINNLCLNCHRNTPDHPDPYAETFIHVSHNEQKLEAIDLSCASCHMHLERVDELHGLPDHTMRVTTKPCTTCHESLVGEGTTNLVAIDTALAQERDALLQQVSALETELDTFAEHQASSQGTNYIQLTQGLIAGLGIGLTLVFVLWRRGSTNGDSGSEDTSNE